MPQTKENRQVEIKHPNNQAADLIPSKCLNPACKHQFHAHNPIFIGGGSTNITVTGTKINCPRCGHWAQMQDWTIDSKGQFNLSELFTELRNVNNIVKLKKFKAQVEAANDEFTKVDLAEELAEALKEIDPNFAKFKESINALPVGVLIQFIGMLMTVITCILTYQALNLQSTSLTIQQQQLELNREEFAYSKNKDEHLSVLDKKIEQMEKTLEKEIKSHNSPQPLPQLKDHQGRLKGNKRNKPCLCGSGLKTKHCHHPNGNEFI